MLDVDSTDDPTHGFYLVQNEGSAPASVTLQATEESNASLAVTVANEAPLAKDELTTITATRTKPRDVSESTPSSFAIAMDDKGTQIVGTWEPLKKRGLCQGGGDDRFGLFLTLRAARHYKNVTCMAGGVVVELK